MNIIKSIDKKVKKINSSLSPKVKKDIKVLKFFFIGMIFVCAAISVIIVMGSYVSGRHFTVQAASGLTAACELFSYRICTAHLTEKTIKSS